MKQTIRLLQDEREENINRVRKIDRDLYENKKVPYSENVCLGPS